MTTEEKAKRYDEAIERAKDFMNGEVHYALKRGENIMCWIFPELRESDGERIRKELIEYIKDQQSSFISAPDCRDKYEEEENDRYNSWIAWLEKQGENSVCKVKIGETYKCIASPRYTCFRMGDIYHVKDNFIAELINTCSGCFVLLEKQGEQNPADEIGNYDHGKVLESLMSEKQTKQKPVNKVEPKQEWSKDDESFLHTTIAYLKDAKEFKKTAENCINWLLSIKERYTWKPNNEQMLAINTAINVIGKGTLNGKQLIELQEQLMKLRGE